MTDPVNPRLLNLLASLSQGLDDDAQAALEAAAGVGGAGAAALLALQEFLGGATVGRLAEACGLTHSGAVRLVAQLERDRLVSRAAGADRRTVEVRLTRAGRSRARRARDARDAVVRETLADLDGADAAVLEDLLDRLVAARVRRRLAARAEGAAPAWWCRTCDLTACGRPDGRCPAQRAAAEPDAGS